MFPPRIPPNARIAGGVSPAVQAAVAGSSPAKSRPSISVCPELTAYITVLLSVVGAVAWAHVLSIVTR